MKKNEPNDPSLILVLFIGFLSFCIGGILGVASLISLPVVESTKALEPDEIEPGTVYYIKGQQSGRTAWRAKEDAWRAGMVDVLRLSEPELNQWSRDRLDIDESPDAKDASDLEGTFHFLPSAVNFRVVEDGLQLATKIELGGYLKDKTVIYQVTGRFEDSAHGIRFVPLSGNIGAAPLGSIPVVRDLLFGLLTKRISKGADVDWLGESLDNLESAEIAEGKLVLRRKAEG
ncbi:hypothetical protein G0Q06_07170 [Puniceicoccales bacterium CK1056]|uniref:Uncharacterized protein n=1 Tax=Oceanipulchritudo coccoides TaxID=2706888 RepID=A0A6B2M0I3_9BACT|nr:hypothetical protein [Oceanipulchritudo coccoides]NDV62223.1 hypothetical protein [Oceanipulchritudo coccoides]